MLTLWASKLDPVLANPIVQGLAINSVSLTANVAKTIPTTLNRTQLGWFITDINAAARLFRTGDFNATNMVLTADATVTVNIWVF